MSNRWVVLALVVGVVAGYSLAGSVVRAQAEPLPFGVGDTVTLRNVHAGSAGEWSAECSVREIQGIYVKCVPPERMGSSFGARPVETWRSMRFVVEIQKHERR